MSESSQQNHQESLLHTEPSFCIYSNDDKFGEAAENFEIINEKLERSATIGESIEAEFSFVENTMRMIDEQEDEDDDDDDDEEEEEERASNRFRELKIEIYPAKGAGGEEDVPSKLRNYAQYLESTGDLSHAEEYYFRATKADPKDGEALSQYAKLVWQLHGDLARASQYFEKAAAAAAGDSNVLAAYPSFLWEIDENEDEEGLSDTQVLVVF